MGAATGCGGVSAASPQTPVELDDATLVARAREGDTRAFEALVRRYQRQLYHLALRITGWSGDAEDVVQEVFLTAWRRLPEIRDDAALPGWLYRTTTNRCLNLLRRSRPTAELDETTPTQAPAEDPQRAAEASQQVRALTAALARLSPKQRAAWLLREVHGRSYEEIADALATTPHAVRGRLARARVQLAELMQTWR
ncbi:MAG TPA: RNA polymerase sigma factor [Pseudonocardiaceae bacterium]|nr:RNA polymerase sigma factor [Pseudonocardiaceae bacterium]